MNPFAAATVLSFLLLIPRLSSAHGSRLELNHGYSLLHHLCEQEKLVDLILMVKTTPPDVADLLHEVARNATGDLGLFERMADRDHAIRFNDQGLPSIELATRASIKDDKQHMLLFGTTGGNFAKTVLITQVEAGTYGMNLASVLADEETDGHRAAELRRMSARWEKLRNKAYALIYKM